MKKIKIFSAVLAVSMLFSLTVSADFTDMPQDENLKVAIENAVAHGILSGYEDGSVRPDANITRAEMASIITRVCGVDNEADVSEFSDVPSDGWIHTAFSKAYYMGAFSGDDQKLMHPQNNITFQECFTILYQVFDLTPPHTLIGNTSPTETENLVKSKNKLYDISVLDGYADRNSIADWAKIFVAGVVFHGGWNGQNGNLTPTSYITRGQFAIVMNNLIQNYIDEPGTYTELPAGNTIIRANDVVLDGIKTEKDIIVADCVEPNALTVNNIEVSRFVVRGCATPLSDKVGLKLTGTYETIRLIRPYVSVDVSSVHYNVNRYPRLYAGKDSNPIVGEVNK